VRASLGRGSRSGGGEPISSPPLTLAAPSPIPLWLQPPPPSLFPFVAATPPLSLSFSPQVIAAPPPNPSRPPPLHGASSPLGTPSCGCESSIGVWRKEEGRMEGGKEEPKVILRSFFLVFVLQSNCLHVYLCESV
jgi:hypothetical protein